MHSCVVTAPTITEFRSRAELLSEAVQKAACIPQLGALSVAAILQSCGDAPSFVDANAVYLQAQAAAGSRELDFAEELARIATQTHADLYCLSSICSTYPLSVRVATAIKRRCPYATILFGGPQASVVDVATLEAFPSVDFILRGEVERTLPALMKELSGDYDFPRVGGLTYRDGGVVRRTDDAPVLDDLDEVPTPAYHLSRYLEGAKSASVELGRGCPFSCTFCSTNHFFRRKFRLRSPARVLQDMRFLAERYGIRHFELVHDMFTVDRRRVVEFCESMAHSGEGFTWDCSARTDCVDEELLELMRSSGCRGIFFGIETGSKRMQRIIDKDLDPERAEEMLAIAQSLGIRTTASLITGFPEEEWSDLGDTVRIFMRSARCSLSLPQLNLLAPLAGTTLYRRHRDELVLEDMYSDMSYQGLSQNPEDLELIRAYPEIFPNFYLIPMKGLDRDFTFEVREFLTAATMRFRWLLCALDEATDLLECVVAWRAWRIARRGDRVGSDLRSYYVGSAFSPDLMEFLRESDIHRDPRVAVLVAVEAALHEARLRRDDSQKDDMAPVPANESLLGDDRVFANSKVLEVPYRLETVVQALADRRSLQARETVVYTTRRETDGTVRLTEISSWLAALLKASERSLTVNDIRNVLELTIQDLEPENRDFTLARLVSGAHAAGWVSIYRAVPMPARAEELTEEPVEAAL